uniref:Uncharacterized protein n=1 Tax=Avena sativa TaxID=4498 RepID=A0ACD5W8N7_AVESA
MPQYVFLFLLMFVLFMHHASTTPSYVERPRNLLQSRGRKSLNSSSQLIDILSIRLAPGKIVHLEAYISYQGHGDVYTGAMGTFDVHGFSYLVKGQSSSSQIWVINKGNGESDNINKIVSGWEVDGDDQTGCYNLNCLGFIPVNGAPITPGDTLELPQGQTRISLKIYKGASICTKVRF